MKRVRIVLGGKDCSSQMESVESWAFRDLTKHLPGVLGQPGILFEHGSKGTWMLLHEHCTDWTLKSMQSPLGRRV